MAGVCFLCFLLVVSFFVSDQIHGKMLRQTPVYNSLLKSNKGVDKSLYFVSESTLHNAASHSHIHSQEGLKEKDRIGRLPGQPHVKFSQYGGYVTVNKKAGRALYYYFVEAPRSKESLPLLLWLNGGPGCSSLAYGAMMELGPFRVFSDGKTLFENKFAWNNVANVLFLESPAGVGFSYSNTTSDYNASGDRITASDNYAFLVNWLERFPEYKNRDFYISGESYAGHYVPQLAQTILHHNRKANRTIIHLKGIVIGNAAIDDERDDAGMYDFFGSHAIISDQTADQIRRHCNFSPNVTNQTKECSSATAEADMFSSKIDIYHIYEPLCRDANLTSIPKKASMRHIDPCSDNYVYAYLNRPEVQASLHANVTKLSYDWEPCSDIFNTWNDSPSTILPVIKKLMDQGLRVWLFSGDVDGRVPFTSTQYSLEKLKLSVKDKWHPWFFNGQVGGFSQVYNGELTFATVRDAGHQVPSYQPARALSLIRHFLDGNKLPQK